LGGPKEKIQELMAKAYPNFNFDPIEADVVSYQKSQLFLFSLLKEKLFPGQGKLISQTENNKFLKRRFIIINILEWWERLGSHLNLIFFSLKKILLLNIR
jgi:hypothetical protein